MELVELSATRDSGIDADTHGRPARRSEPGFDVPMATGEHGRRPRQWRIRCRDVANRERFLTVFAEQGRVVLVGPPGESAVFTPGQLGELRTVLRQAADEAER